MIMSYGVDREDQGRTCEWSLSYGGRVNTATVRMECQLDSCYKEALKVQAVSLSSCISGVVCITFRVETSVLIPFVEATSRHTPSYTPSRARGPTHSLHHYIRFVLQI